MQNSPLRQRGVLYSSAAMKYYARLAVTLYFILFIFTIVLWRKSKTFVEVDVYRKSPAKFYKLHNAMQMSNEAAGRSQKDFSDTLRNRDPYISYLVEGHLRQCEGHFIGFKNLFAKLVNVLVDPRFGKGRRGGENMSDVMNQEENKEFYTLNKGFFRFPCKEKVKYEFGVDSHLNNWVDVLDYRNSKLRHYEISDWTIAIQRYEYVNMYHTMTDWYNTFLVTKVFKLDPKNVTILWVDGHPSGGLDATWGHLFGRIIRIGKIRNPTLFTNMIWGIVGYDSPLDEHSLPEVAYLEEFRNFFLSNYNIIPEDDLNCRQLNVLLIWRRDYVAHPRNPSGSVSRKIKNEDELLSRMKDVFKGHIVNGIQIDKLPMQKQLSVISKTDILIGMHGAGLSHTLFLPRHAGLIEMFPAYHPAENIHFRSMAEWRHLYYLSWSNIDMERELDNHLTVVNVDEIALLAKDMKQKICPGNET